MATKLRPSKIYKGAGGRIAINSRVPLFTRLTVSLEEFYIKLSINSSSKLHFEGGWKTKQK